MFLTVSNSQKITGLEYVSLSIILSSIGFLAIVVITKSQNDGASVKNVSA